MYLSSRKFLLMICDLGMKSPAPTQAITTAEAEIACIRGEAATLSQYLGQTPQPAVDVIHNIATCLLANLPGSNLGPGDWKLKFSPRNGRPPKKHLEITYAASAIAHGQTMLLGQYLRAAPTLDDDTRLALAAALDPEASPRWRLKFARTRSGFSRSQLGSDLRIIYRENEFRRLRSQGKLGKQISHEMGVSPTNLKKAVRAMKKPPKKTPE
jgi:hypothetical protein